MCQEEKEQHLEQREHPQRLEKAAQPCKFECKAVIRGVEEAGLAKLGMGPSESGCWDFID